MNPPCRFVWLIALVVTLAGAQEKTNQQRPARITMCDLYRNPEQYSGTIIAVRSSVSGNDLWIDDYAQSPCPSWTKVVLVLAKNNTELIKDSTYNLFFDDLRKGMSVEATFVGRLDVAFVWRDHKRIFLGTQKKGFGKKGDAGAQLVLQQISEVTARPGMKM